MPINPNIALAVKPAEIQVPNMLAQAAQFAQLQEAQAVAEERNRLRALNPSAADYEQQLFRVSPQLGIQYRKERTAAEASEALRQKNVAEAAAAKQKMMGQAMRDISSRPSDANITAHMEDVLDSNLYSPEEKAAVQKRSQMLLGMPFADRQLYLAQQGATAGELKPSTQQVNRMGQTDIVQVPYSGAPTTVGSYADVPLPAAVAAQKKEIARAGAPSISVSTEKKYGEAFGGKLAEVDIGKMTTAEKAPQLADSANRIIGLVQQGNVFTGPAADVKLNLARALNVAGASNQEKIANTESLIAATGQSTLDAIKGAGLGTGQGFTDKDLKFLQGIAGGTVNLTPQTLTELATLQHRVATRSAESWNKRVKEMPQEVVRSTGLDTTPITVAPMQSVMKRSGAAPAASAVPAGVDPALWNVMTPQEQALWPK